MLPLQLRCRHIIEPAGATDPVCIATNAAAAAALLALSRHSANCPQPLACVTAALIDGQVVLVPSHAQTLKARMHVLAAFDERGLSSVRVNGYCVSSSSSDEQCVMQLVQAAGQHVQPILRMQRDLLSHCAAPSPDAFASSLFASVAGVAVTTLLTADPALPPRDL